jgi:hypothetical protein
VRLWEPLDGNICYFCKIIGKNAILIDLNTSEGISRVVVASGNPTCDFVIAGSWSSEMSFDRQFSVLTRNFGIYVVLTSVLSTPFATG